MTNKKACFLFLYLLLNKYKKKVRETLELLPLDNSSILSNSWLVGFSDSDANFNISYSIGMSKENNGPICNSIALTFRFSQRQEYHQSVPGYSSSYFDVLSSIAKAFNSKVETISSDRKLSIKNITLY